MCPIMLNVRCLLIIYDVEITGLSSPTIWPIFSVTEARYGCPGITGAVFAGLRSRTYRKQPQFCGAYAVYTKN